MLRPRSLVPEGGYPDSYWRSLFYFNVYRTHRRHAAADDGAGVRGLGVRLAQRAACSCTPPFGYIAFSGLAFVADQLASARISTSSSAIQVIADVLFVTLLVYASGGVSSGLGLLLLASLAAAGIISRGRMTLFFAALASRRGAARADLRGASRTPRAPRHYIQAGLLSDRLLRHRLAGAYAGALHAGERAARRAARSRSRQHGAGQSARDPGHEGRRAGGRRARQRSARSIGARSRSSVRCPRPGASSRCAITPRSWPIGCSAGARTPAPASTRCAPC